MEELRWWISHAPEMLIHVVTAAMCGTAMGYERARNGGAAGMKTCMLICLGATAYTHVGVALFEQTHEGDPTRVASQIVSGIGFLGAGAILRGNGGVTGLTTAAIIWFLGAVGIIIGSGFPASGFGLTLGALALLTAIRLLEARLVPEHTAHHGGDPPEP
jgi:putative Mg2+ transporter-C (MgtC) family protein